MAYCKWHWFDIINFNGLEPAANQYTTCYNRLYYFVYVASSLWYINEVDSYKNINAD